ncbi:MAG: asparagine synthetase B, partial [Chromatiaceae bacterium]|nr:asparagine synthetase B [Chromatiaceae bacterium]
ARWFRGPLRERLRTTLLGAPMLDSGFFERRALEGLIEAHLSGQRDYSPALWSLLMFDVFLRRTGQG